MKGKNLKLPFFDNERGKSESYWPLPTVPATLGVNWKCLFTTWPLIWLINRH